MQPVRYDNRPIVNMVNFYCNAKIKCNVPLPHPPPQLFGLDLTRPGQFEYEQKKQEKKLVNTEHRDESPSTRPRTIMRVFRKQRDSATRFVIFNGTVPNQAVTVDNVSVRFRRLTVLLVHYLNETAIRRINSRFEPIDRSRASSSFRQQTTVENVPTHAKKK